MLADYSPSVQGEDTYANEAEVEAVCPGSANQDGQEERLELVLALVFAPLP